MSESTDPKWLAEREFISALMGANFGALWCSELLKRCGFDAASECVLTMWGDFQEITTREDERTIIEHSMAVFGRRMDDRMQEWVDRPMAEFRKKYPG